MRQNTAVNQPVHRGVFSYPFGCLPGNTEIIDYNPFTFFAKHTGEPPHPFGYAKDKTKTLFVSRKGRLHCLTHEGAQRNS